MTTDLVLVLQRLKRGLEVGLREVDTLLDTSVALRLSSPTPHSPPQQEMPPPAKRRKLNTSSSGQLRLKKLSDIKAGTWNYVFFMAVQLLCNANAKKVFTPNDILKTIHDDEDLNSEMVGIKGVEVSTYFESNDKYKSLRKRCNTHLNRFHYEFEMGIKRINPGEYRYFPVENTS